MGIPAEPPHAFGFLPNYPNPFNPSTTLRFELPFSSDVSITIYNIMGAEVATALAGRRPAGLNTVEWDASRMPSGVYVARLHAGSFEQTRKLVLLK